MKQSRGCSAPLRARRWARAALGRPGPAAPAAGGTFKPHSLTPCSALARGDHRRAVPPARTADSPAEARARHGALVQSRARAVPCPGLPCPAARSRAHPSPGQRGLASAASPARPPALPAACRRRWGGQGARRGWGWWAGWKTPAWAAAAPAAPSPPSPAAAHEPAAEPGASGSGRPCPPREPRLGQVRPGGPAPAPPRGCGRAAATAALGSLSPQPCPCPAPQLSRVRRVRSQGDVRKHWEQRGPLSERGERQARPWHTAEVSRGVVHFHRCPRLVQWLWFLNTRGLQIRCSIFFPCRLPVGSLTARLPWVMRQERLCRVSGAVKHRPPAASARLPGCCSFSPRGSSTLSTLRKQAFGFSQESAPVVGLSRQSVCAASAGLRPLITCVTLVQTLGFAMVLFHLSFTRKYCYFLSQH